MFAIKVNHLHIKNRFLFVIVFSNIMQAQLNNVLALAWESRLQDQ